MLRRPPPPLRVLGVGLLAPDRSPSTRDVFAVPCGYLDVSAGVDFVNGVSGGPTRLPVQIVALDKHGVVTQASHPHIALALALKLDAFADVKPERGE